jgi:hypothetical protein
VWESANPDFSWCEIDRSIIVVADHCVCLFGGNGRHGGLRLRGEHACTLGLDIPGTVPGQLPGWSMGGWESAKG